MGDEDATDLRCGMTLTQLRNMDSHMASMLQQHAKNGGSLPYGPPTPPGGQHPPAPLHHGQQISAPSGHPAHAGHPNHPPHHGHAAFGYHNAFAFGQGHGYGHQEEATGNYLSSMHQMVEANQLQSGGGSASAPPPLPLPPSSYGSHQQHLAALAAQAQEQQNQHGKYAKSSPMSAMGGGAGAGSGSGTGVGVGASAGPGGAGIGSVPPSGGYFVDSQTAPGSQSQIGYDERSMSSASDLEDDDDDTTKLHLDVTSPPTPSPRGPLAPKRKSAAGAFCDDNEPKLANGQSSQLGNYGIRARSLDEVQAQQHQQQQSMQQSHQQQGYQSEYRSSSNGNPNGNSGDHGERMNADNDSLVNGSCASSEDLNQTNSSEQGEKITSGSDDEGEIKRNRIL